MRHVFHSYHRANTKLLDEEAQSVVIQWRAYEVDYDREKLSVKVNDNLNYWQIMIFRDFSVRLCPLNENPDISTNLFKSVTFITQKVSSERSCLSL